MISQFRGVYKKELELLEFYFTFSLVNQNKSAVLALVLKSRVANEETNKSVEINLKYKLLSGIYKDFFQFTWMFDKKKSTPYWITSEAEEYQQSILRKSYAQPIIAFRAQDYVEIQINVFSKGSIMSCEDCEWEEAIYTDSPKISFLDYEKSLQKTPMQYDKLRFCELENMIHVWKGDQSLTIRKFVDELKRLFVQNFRIDYIKYDFSKFYIYKVKMLAKEKGLIRKNKFFQFDLEIKESKEHITHSIKSLGLLNYVENKFELRVDTYIIFYFTDIYF